MNKVQEIRTMSLSDRSLYFKRKLVSPYKVVKILRAKTLIETQLQGSSACNIHSPSYWESATLKTCKQTLTLFVQMLLIVDRICNVSSRDIACPLYCNKINENCWITACVRRLLRSISIIEIITEKKNHKCQINYTGCFRALTSDLILLIRLKTWKTTLWYFFIFVKPTYFKIII